MNILEENEKMVHELKNRRNEISFEFYDFMNEHDDLWDNFPDKFYLYYLKDDRYFNRHKNIAAEPGFVDILVRSEEPFDIIEIDGVPVGLEQAA